MKGIYKDYASWEGNGGMWEKILCENMKRMLLSFCIEAIHIIAEGSGERTPDGSFKELRYMEQVVDSLYCEWFEPLYQQSEMADSLERYYGIFKRICTTLDENHFVYDEI